MRTHRLAALCLLAGAGLAGCLPGSGRQMDRSVSAADSASVALAAAVPADSLARVWAADLSDLPLATSLAWLGSGAAARLVVAETQGGALHLVGADGRRDPAAWRVGDGTYPYLAGTRGDTAVVHCRGTSQLAWLVGGRVARRVPAPAGATGALATDGALWVRTGGGPEQAAGALLRLGEAGRVRARHPLRGPAWRHVGFVRAWGGRVAALSGYRPVVDVVAPGARHGARADTVALVGFDSPQLPRSAQYQRGEVDAPPLLASSAVALGPRLLVLNQRADRVRVDVYAASGRLERVLEGPPSDGLLDAVAVDLAVRRVGASVEVAVLLARPAGVFSVPAARVELFRWRGAAV